MSNDLNNLIGSLSIEQLQALVKQANQAKKDAQAKESARLAEVGRTFVEDVVTSTDAHTSEKSGWTGHSARFSITIDDTEYGVSVTVTDVKATETRKAEMEAEKKAKESQDTEASTEQDTEVAPEPANA